MIACVRVYSQVFLVCDVADIAGCVYRICLHTLLNSERSVCSWLDRDWFSVLPTEVVCVSYLLHLFQVKHIR